MFQLLPKNAAFLLTGHTFDPFVRQLPALHTTLSVMRKKTRTDSALVLLVGHHKLSLATQSP
jgi:hypothetical protein